MTAVQRSPEPVSPQGSLQIYKVHIKGLVDPPEPESWGPGEINLNEDGRLNYAVASIYRGTGVTYCGSVVRPNRPMITFRIHPGAVGDMLVQFVQTVRNAVGGADW